MKSRYLTPDEFRRILNKLPADRRLIYDVCVETGLRIGDCLKIRKRDLQPAKGGYCTISYTAEKTGKKGSAVVGGTCARQLLGAAKRKGGYIWPGNGKTGHITRQAAWKWFKDAARAACIPLDGVSPHALRKCFAVELRHRRGLHAAQTALQHTNSATTAIYAYADSYCGYAPDSPILWCQIEQLIEMIAERINYAKQMD